MNRSVSCASAADEGARAKNSCLLSSGPVPACTYWWLRAYRTCTAQATQMQQHAGTQEESAHTLRAHMHGLVLTAAAPINIIHVCVANCKARQHPAQHPQRTLRHTTTSAHNATHLHGAQGSRQVHALVECCYGRLCLLLGGIAHKGAAARLTCHLVLQDDDVLHITKL